LLRQVILHWGEYGIRVFPHVFVTHLHGHQPVSTNLVTVTAALKETMSFSIEIE